MSQVLVKRFFAYVGFGYFHGPGRRVPDTGDTVRGSLDLLHQPTRQIGTIQGLLMMGGFVIASAVAFGCDIKTVGVYLAFLLYSGITVVFGMVMMNLSIELLPKLNIAMLIALSNTIMMPLVLIAPMLAGLIIDLTGSYAVVFVLSAVLSAVSALGFLFLVHEPRKRKIHVVKYIRRV